MHLLGTQCCETEASFTGSSAAVPVRRTRIKGHGTRPLLTRNHPIIPHRDSCERHQVLVGYVVIDYELFNPSHRSLNIDEDDVSACLH